jgi:hypothetical protein
MRKQASGFAEDSRKIKSEMERTYFSVVVER